MIDDIEANDLTAFDNNGTEDISSLRSETDRELLLGIITRLDRFEATAIETYQSMARNPLLQQMLGL
jgi:hypothetical protein